MYLRIISHPALSPYFPSLSGLGPVSLAERTQVLKGVFEHCPCVPAERKQRLYKSPVPLGLIFFNVPSNVYYCCIFGGLSSIDFFWKMLRKKLEFKRK